MEFVYLPLSQNPNAGMTLMLETEGPSGAMTAPLRDLVRRLDAHQPIFGIRTMEELFDVRATQTLGILNKAIGGLAVLALVLALVGLYGLMTYSVSLRQREMGIRMAIGGDQGTVVRMVLKQAMVLAASGVAIGLALTLVASKPTTSIVNAEGFNWPLVALVTLILLAMAAFGAYIPARRASRVDPNTVLRQE
jgi:ABC-type antimicrobial peptide transport system permease subunit